MRRRIAAFLATMLAAGGLMVFANAQPANAVWICAGQGTAATGQPVFYPGLNPATNPPNTFTFLFSLGACAHLPSGTTNKTIAATGEFLGWCGLSSGLGNLAQGDLFAWIGIGSMLVLTGHIVGLVNATPDVLAGESCVTGADRFLVTGFVVLLNCTSLLGPDVDTLTPSLPVLGSPHIWINSPCVPDPLAL